MSTLSLAAAPSAGARLLVFAPAPHARTRWLDALAAADGCGVAPPSEDRGGDSRGDLGDADRVLVEGKPVTLVFADSVDATAARLHDTYFNAVLLDLRACAEDASPGALQERLAAGRLLVERLDRVAEVESRYGFHRLMLLLSGPNAALLDPAIARFGLMGVEHVQRQYDEPEPAFAAAAARAALALVADRDLGRRALCCAGGGITGIYFELGVLKCLDDCLDPDPARPSAGVNGFDMLYGISAGAVVAGFLANGYAPEEFMASIAGHTGGRLPPIDLSVLDPRHLDLRDLRRRGGLAAKAALRGVADIATGRGRLTLERLLFEYGEIIGAPLSSRRFGELLEAAFTLPGATDDFRRLPRPLYIGATDQDTRQHVLFGGRGHDHVPLHLAIRASLSFNPAFGPTRIDGRYYEDGSVTRTSNFEHAIQRGAKLVLVVDPFVPYVSREVGHAAARGLLYNLDQNVRAISYTRYENTRNWILRKHPDVSAYTILPSNRTRRVLTINPMDHRPYLAIWRGAYLSTLARLRVLEHRLAGDLAAYGLTFDTARADAVAERLSRVEQPALADFFPDGVVRLRERPLALAPSHRPPASLTAATSALAAR